MLTGEFLKSASIKGMWQGLGSSHAFVSCSILLTKPNQGFSVRTVNCLDPASVSACNACSEASGFIDLKHV